MFKVNNKDIRTRSMTSFCVFLVNCEYISHLVMVFLLLTLRRYMAAGLFHFKWRSYNTFNNLLLKRQYKLI